MQSICYNGDHLYNCCTLFLPWGLRSILHVGQDLDPGSESWPVLLFPESRSLFLTTWGEKGWVYMGSCVG